MKSLLLSVVMALVGLTTANAQVVSNNYDSPVTQESKSENNSEEKETVGYIGLGFWSFSQGENYGLTGINVTPNGLGVDFAYRMEFHEHGNFNVDFGPNYSFNIWGNGDAKLLLTAALGPSFRLQDQIDEKKSIKEGKEEWKEKFFVDMYINARATFNYKRIVISAGYYYWAPKFKFGKDKGLGAFYATLGYCL